MNVYVPAAADTNASAYVAVPVQSGRIALVFEDEIPMETEPVAAGFTVAVHTAVCGGVTDLGVRVSVRFGECVPCAIACPGMIAPAAVHVTTAATRTKLHITVLRFIGEVKFFNADHHSPDAKQSCDRPWRVGPDELGLAGTRPRG